MKLVLAGLLDDDYIKYSDSNAKYVLYSCDGFCGGWGDRLKGILSAYAWSLLTERQFRIHVTQPCNLEAMLKPNKIYWNAPMTRNGGQGLQLHPNFSHVYLNKVDNFEFSSKLKDLDIANFKSDKDLIVFTNNRDWFEAFSANKLLTERLAQLGYPDQAKFKLFYLFRDWYGDLFRLSPQLQSKYDAYLGKIIRRKLICAQIRIGGKRPNVKYDYKFNNRNVSRLFWTFIRQNLTMNETNFTLFVTTDTESVYDEAVRVFGQETVMTIDGLYTHLDREADLKENCSRVDKTVLDLHFMQNCDSIVISDSNFGKFGVMLRRDPTRSAFIFKDNKFHKIDFKLSF